MVAELKQRSIHNGTLFSQKQKTKALSRTRRQQTRTDQEPNCGIYIYSWMNVGENKEQVGLIN